jgi:hypothetical protein
MNANHHDNIARANNLTEMISDFINRLRAKQGTLQSFIDEGTLLDVDIRNFLEELGEQREEFYFWRYINEPMRNFFEMDLSEILGILLEDYEWPHPDEVEQEQEEVVPQQPALFIEIPPLDMEALLQEEIHEENDYRAPPGGSPSR